MNKVFVVECIKDFYDCNYPNKLLNKQGKCYEAKIVFNDILVKDEDGEFSIVGFKGEEAQDFNLPMGQEWDLNFENHFIIR